MLQCFNIMKSLNAETDTCMYVKIINIYQFDMRLKLLEKKENNKKYVLFHHNFTNIPCYKNVRYH